MKFMSGIFVFWNQGGKIAIQLDGMSLPLYVFLNCIKCGHRSLMLSDIFRVTLIKYSFSRCYCKIVLCWYVDSLVCRLRNYAKKLIFKEFVR